MKETYLEQAQKEVFTEAKISKRVKYKPSPAFIAKCAKLASDSFFSTFAEMGADQDELNVTNPAKFIKLCEAYAFEALDDAIEQYFDDERNYEVTREFVREVVEKKIGTKVTPRRRRIIE